MNRSAQALSWALHRKSAGYHSVERGRPGGAVIEKTTSRCRYFLDIEPLDQRLIFRLGRLFGWQEWQ